MKKIPLKRFGNRTFRHSFRIHLFSRTTINSMDNSLFITVDNYIQNMLAKEDQALLETITSLDKAGIPQISVSANQGKFCRCWQKFREQREYLSYWDSRRIQYHLAGESIAWQWPADYYWSISEYAAVARQNLRKSQSRGQGWNHNRKNDWRFASTHPG